MEGHSKMKKIAILAATAAALLAPAQALANTFKQEGFVDGDKAAKVKLRVEVKNGRPDKVAGFRALNVRAHCEKGPVRITLRAVTPIHVNRDGSFKERLEDEDGGVLRIAGEVKDGGKKVLGSLKTSEFQSGSQSCKVPRQGWKTTA
jgi:hypothetical protein